MAASNIYGKTWADALFLRARLYNRPATGSTPRVREGRAASSFHPWNERHLQCVWFDPALRPSSLRTADGERVRIEDPGVWNLEAGPDFLGAAIRIEPGSRRMAGDVEIHVHPSDWNAHRHAKDPRYSRVRVHVSFFPGDGANAALPPGAVHIVLRETLAASPGFDFGNIDVSAYPFAARGRQPPCAQRLDSWKADTIGALLDAAGEERLRRKALRLRARIEKAGAEQTLYEELLCAFGYKHNKAPFRQLAETVPLAILRENTNGDPLAAYALLAGVAGLLPDRANSRWDEETRTFVRSLWDFWWKQRGQWGPQILPPTAWRTAGLRPANHPVRRLMAAAVLFSRAEPVGVSWLHLAQEQPDCCEEIVSKELQSLKGFYWARRFSFSGKPQPKTAALIGASRADEIIVNVLTPFLAAHESTAVFSRGLLERLPAESDNGIARQTAFSLFGPDHPPSLHRSSLRKQGLIQIFHDFCLNDRSRCATCELPMLLDSHNGGSRIHG